MESDLDPIVVAPNLNGNAEDACGVAFYGDYHYCGAAEAGFVQCCLGELN